MRKTLVGFVVLALGLALGCVTTHAQTTVTLGGGSCNSCFGFAVSGSSLKMTMSPATTSNFALATGTGPSIPTLTMFTLWESAPILMTNAGGGMYNVAPGSGAFEIAVAMGTFTLNGVLSIQNLSVATNSGTYDTTVMGNFNINPLTSSYCMETGAVCGPGAGYGKVLLTFGSMVPPVPNGARGGFNSASIVIPASNLAATPEPTSMLLFGTGLLVFGAVLRRRAVLRRNSATT
jgi:hypothetical protein